MLTAAQRAHLTVVLAGARNPSNIGAAARAMHDFGFSSLVVANGFAPPLEAAQMEAHKAAVAAGHVLAAARRVDTVAEAVADCHMVVATTALGGRELTQAVVPLVEAAPQILAALARDERVALLFGSEKTGLTGEQLSHATLLTTIPMFQPEGARHLSMNLAQSVAVCLYELSRDGLAGARELPARHEAPATAGDRERVTQLLLDVMQATGYTRRYPANANEATVRQLAQQMGSSHREAMTWMGVLKQVLWRERGDVRKPDNHNP